MQSAPPHRSNCDPSPQSPDSSVPSLRWDIFCEVIDNLGDLGVCWRLACNLAARAQSVRLWIDDAASLAWMAPGGQAHIEVRAWPRHADELQAVPPADVLVETFGCSPPPCAIAHFFEAINQGPTCASPGFRRWINIEHLTAESFAERSHGLPSPVQHGPGRGQIRHFFYPGFSQATGGLLREAELLQRKARFHRSEWLACLGIPHTGERLVALFCYEPAALAALLERLAQDPQPSRLLVAADRSAAAVRRVLPDTLARGSLRIDFLPRMSQLDFDRLLWTADLNFVRGEDSLVRALWAAKPFVWQAYPQHDGAHHAKLEALLRTLQLPASLTRWHRLWNDDHAPGALPPLALEHWQPAVEAASTRLLNQPDLTTQLLRFVQQSS